MRPIFFIAAVFFLCYSCQDDSSFEQYLDSLNEYPSYDYTEGVEIDFTYMESSNLDLKALKDKFDLESIAGNGNELSKMVNLMLWVNENLKHDGNSDNPFPPNADHIIEVCREENRGVNCRMMATVLNEFYLAMDFNSRHITCMPVDHDFLDCHVVVAVYSKQLNQWIMMDPTFAGYFLDENGDVMGLVDIREKLTQKEQMKISKSLNHNRRSYSRNDYVQYMTKNTFRFSCPADSEYNYEAQPYNSRVYVELVPVGYRTENKSNHTYVRNPDNFWTRPH